MNYLFGGLFVGIVLAFATYLLMSTADYSIDMSFTDKEKEQVNNDFKEGLRNVGRKD